MDDDTPILTKVNDNILLGNKAIALNDPVIQKQLGQMMQQNIIQNVLNKYSQNGWKLHSITTNEVGKTLTGVSIGFIGGNINATICQTILIFERCIKS